MTGIGLFFERIYMRLPGEFELEHTQTNASICHHSNPNADNESHIRSAANEKWLGTNVFARAEI